GGRGDDGARRASLECRPVSADRRKEVRMYSRIRRLTKWTRSFPRTGGVLYARGQGNVRPATGQCGSPCDSHPQIEEVKFMKTERIAGGRRMANRAIPARSRRSP